jgi:hypothetical protein
LLECFSRNIELGWQGSGIAGDGSGGAVSLRKSELSNVGLRPSSTAGVSGK